MSHSLKSFLLFAVWTAVTVVLFRPFGYVAIAGLVAIGTAAAEFLASRSISAKLSIKLASMAPLAFLHAVFAATTLTSMFYFLLVVTEITGPDLSYAPPPLAMVFVRALLCSFVAALLSLYFVRRLTVYRRSGTATQSPRDET